jgi:hypothetical protein
MTHQPIDIPVERVHDILADAFERLLPRDDGRAVRRADASSPTLDAVACEAPDDRDASRRVGGKPPEEGKLVATASAPASAAAAAAASPLANSSPAAPSSSAADDRDTIFDSCSDFVITGHELTGNIVNLSTHAVHVLCRPTVISDERYERNALLFSVGFVLRRSEDSRPFRPVLSKLSSILRDMELESQFLSSEQTRPLLQGHLDRVLLSLNGGRRWECHARLDGANALHLKLFHPPGQPAPPVPDHAVPILLRRERLGQVVSVSVLY